MFTSSQQLADAKANGKIFAVLSIAGALAGAVAGPAVHFKSLPPAAQLVVTPAYIAKFNIARLAPLANQRWRETRASAYEKAPALAAQLDQFPASIAVGAGTGALALPLSLGMLIAAVRRKKIPKQSGSRKSAVADFLPR